jgi:hypothetical protein
MAASVIRATIHLCISGDIEIPSPEMLSEIRFKVVNAIHRKLAVLPDRIDLYEKGLVSFWRNINSILTKVHRTYFLMGPMPMLRFCQMR